MNDLEQVVLWKKAECIFCIVLAPFNVKVFRSLNVMKFSRLGIDSSIGEIPGVSSKKIKAITLFGKDEDCYLLSSFPCSGYDRGWDVCVEEGTDSV